jgi:predicted membrane protein
MWTNDERHHALGRGRRRVEMSGQLLVSLIIVAVGVVLLLDNFGLVESGRILRLWPAILVLIGLKNIFETRDRNGAVGGALMAGIGGLMLLNTLNIIDFRLRDLWPLFLIVFGFQMLMRSISGPAKPSDATDTDESFSNSAFLSGVKRRNGSPHFRGGSATALMGGIELDLRTATMEGNSAVINVSVMMGGIEIRIPETWSLESQVVPILGGIDDKTTPAGDTSKRLVLKGTVLLGGVEVKN